ncbi:uncharacterized protein CTHT_0016600 [Thermochaetoides thermophila DSM 1495]|uniref:tRNA (guanine(9)-N1)-methyltransferase n=1 Tax=Chaetomium thermophilum (strain DSM 1495 / CBS 144.50 / IMI 039719) TaxID=759272 RepID=G0S2B0_CHATD|nr:hypothetical protein CTHT_0016600 [Thermochaetoides thermophila DSM 1495]EGS22143.1 hypothetical protein CTHT_0016600 [Thermochaetoides thermophila DSM 1495]
MTSEGPIDTNMPDATDAISDHGSVTTTSGKRKAEEELERTPKKNSPPGNEQEEPKPANATAESTNAETTDPADKPLSKSQLKRLRKQQYWEQQKEARKAKRKEKRHERQARKRAEREAKIAEAKAAGIDPATVLQPKEPWKYRPVPVAFIIDCDFEQYMREQELVSLSSQIVRSYAMNRKAKYQASLHISSWKGKLKERFETVLRNTHKNWKNVGIHEGDFIEAAKKAREEMMSPKGGEMIDLIKPVEGSPSLKGNPAPEDDESSKDIDQTIVYLTSESPYTLERLEANTSYVIGGLVDRNREKGLCYKRAKQYKVRTAKLPIGEYMAMQSRYVLTTNQVVEIMAKWLECGDWGEAFLAVIPKRKGGTLKNNSGADSSVTKDDDNTGSEGEESDEDDHEAGDLGEIQSPTNEHDTSPAANEAQQDQQTPQ